MLKTSIPADDDARCVLVGYRIEAGEMLIRDPPPTCFLLPAILVAISAFNFR